MKRLVLMAFCGLSLLFNPSPVKAQSPVAGQPYQVPDGYASYGAGTLINYGGYNYVIQANATMLLADQQGDSSPPADDSSASQAYQVPDGYSGYAAGTVISYGGSSYVLQSNGTMLLSSQGTDPGQGGQVYQTPDGYSGYPAGTVITYGGANYTLGLNGTMVIVTNTYKSQYQPPGSLSKPGAFNGQPGMTRQPQSGMTRQPQSGMTRQPQPGMTRQPQSGMTRQPQSGMTRQPQSGMTRQPQSGMTRQPQSGMTRQPQPNRGTVGNGGGRPGGMTPAPIRRGR